MWAKVYGADRAHSGSLYDLVESGKADVVLIHQRAGLGSAELEGKWIDLIEHGVERVGIVHLDHYSDPDLHRRRLVSLRETVR